MRTSSARVPPELKTPSVPARNCLWTNLLGLPGLGSFLAGKRIAGITQIAIALTGFALTIFWFCAFIAEWIATKEFPFTGGRQFRWGLIGLGVFALAWFWGLATGLQIRRAARTNNA